MFEAVGQSVESSRHICPADGAPEGYVKRTLKLTCAAACAAAVVSVASEARAVVVFDDNFDSYTSGQPLLGQGGWTITGTSTVNPLMVAGGPDNHVPLTTTGQDAFKAFDSGVVHADGDDLQTSVEINVSAAQAAGDYFFHLSDPVATTTNFFQRLFARSSGTGFQLGIQGTSGTGGTVAYGSTVLNLNQTYDVDIDWNFLPGQDTFEVFVDGTSYLTHVWDSVTAEPATITAANLRQGTAANAATVQVDSIVVQGDTVVPEPASLSLLGLAGLAMTRRRSK